MFFTQSRAEAAKNILKMVGGEQLQLVKDYSVLTDALIQLANTHVTTEILRPSQFKLVALSSLQNAHVHTHHLQVMFCLCTV